MGAGGRGMVRGVMLFFGNERVENVSTLMEIIP